MLKMLKQKYQIKAKHSYDNVHKIIQVYITYYGGHIEKS